MSPLSSRPEARDRQLANLRAGAAPAPPGNQRALQHGAYAALRREEVEAEEGRILEALEADAPLRDPDGGLPSADGVAVRLLASCLVRLQRVEAYLTAHGFLDEKGEPRPVLEVEGRLRREALDAAEALGMTPRSRSKLGLELVRAAATAEDAEATREARERLDGRLAALDGEAEEVDGE